MFNFAKINRLSPEAYTEKLKEILGNCLKSVILYGSAASGEYFGGKSDYNLLLIAEHWGILELNQLAKVTQQWLKEGNPPPLLFTFERMQASVDCFPIEMLDMKQNHRLLHGVDILTDIKVQPVHLRLMTERELKTLKIQLRQGFVMAEGDPKKVAELMESTLSTSIVLFRAALRLYIDTVPMKKHEVLLAIAEKVKGVDLEAFEILKRFKHEEVKVSQINPLELFDRYMKSLMAVDDILSDTSKRG